KVLVTGGAGFIGSHVVDALRDARIEPRILDLRSSPYHPSRSVATVIGDLSDLRSLTSATEGCDAVVHLAAAADVAPVAREPRALAGEPLQIAGEGLQSRRFVYVEDLANGVVRALGPAGANGIFNLVGERSVTIREVAHTVGEIVGDVDIVHTPARAADFGGLELSGERAATELGWRAATPFREGVRRYVEWHRAAT